MSFVAHYITKKGASRRYPSRGEDAFAGGGALAGIKKGRMSSSAKKRRGERRGTHNLCLGADLRLAVARLARDRWSLGSAAELDPRTLVGDGGAVERPRSRVAHRTIFGGEKLVVRKLRRRRRGEDKVETARRQNGIYIAHLGVQVPISRGVRSLKRLAGSAVEHGALRRVERHQSRAAVREQLDFGKLGNPRAATGGVAVVRIARIVLANCFDLETKVRVRRRARVATRQSVVRVAHARRALLVPPRSIRVRFDVA